MQPMPNTVIGLIEALEVDYPPRCKTPSESLEEHSIYAGKVELIVHLRARYEAIIRAEQDELPRVLNQG